MKKKPVKKLAVCTALTLCACMIGAQAAGDLASSAIGVGIKNMLDDALAFLQIICPTVGGVAAVVFLIRCSMADEQDKKMWKGRIVIAVVCAVSSFLVMSVIKLASSYFAV